MYLKSGRVYKPGAAGFALVQVVGMTDNWNETSVPNAKLEQPPFTKEELTGEQIKPNQLTDKLQQLNQGNTGGVPADTLPDKGDVAKKLKALNIKFDGRASVEDLVKLLPKE